MSEISDYQNLLNKLLSSQNLAVLATHYNEQPYSNLIAFATTSDFKQIIFVTNRNTQKYKNIRANNKVAILVDSRTSKASDFSDASALTAIGIARETIGEEKKHLSNIYLNKHPFLDNFMNEPGSTLISIAVSDYIIAGFKNARRIIVGD